MKYINSSILVIHILNGLNYGGLENICLELIKYSPNNIKNILLNLDPSCNKMLPAFQKIDNLSIIEMPYLKNINFYFIFNLKKFFQRYQPQAIIIHPFSIVHILVAIAARLTFVKKIAVKAGNPPPQNNPLERSKWKMLIVTSRLLGVSIHCCSHTVHKQFQSLAKLPEGSFPIPNGCDVENIAQRAALTRQQQLDSMYSKKLIIGMVARLNTIKDHETLIRAFAIIQNNFPNTELWLVGEGENKEQLQTLARELHVEKEVVFWGGRSDVPELLGQMDIYAFSTTVNEGFGVALIEAMAASLPIVASDVSACREVLNNGTAGLLASPNSPEALAQMLEKLLQSIEQREDWGKKAFERAVSNYSSQVCAEQWYNLVPN